MVAALKIHKNPIDLQAAVPFDAHALQSYAAIAGSQAQIIDLPALQYGLFHAQVQPRKPFGLITTGISFKGLNMDIGHVRSIRWVKDDNPQSPINNKPELRQNGKPAAQNRWIAYNKAKGQYGSAQEHATPEAFWVDKKPMPLHRHKWPNPEPWPTTLRRRHQCSQSHRHCAATGAEDLHHQSGEQEYSFTCTQHWRRSRSGNQKRHRSG